MNEQPMGQTITLAVSLLQHIGNPLNTITKRYMENAYPVIRELIKAPKVWDMLASARAMFPKSIVEVAAAENRLFDDKEVPIAYSWINTWYTKEGKKTINPRVGCMALYKVDDEHVVFSASVRSRSEKGNDPNISKGYALPRVKTAAAFASVGLEVPRPIGAVRLKIEAIRQLNPEQSISGVGAFALMAIKQALGTPNNMDFNADDSDLIALGNKFVGLTQRVLGK